ncbi:4'-phosphopantetheinyl transferase superfamily protein [Streptomyces sp. NBC_00247]|uniref:4'-phosphopantetheinyl transferase family protein n=1 Tax=Streptomyces sp. NBC_00247 TaxID=2975689 RepID=UPI002E2E7D5A|nr:4'-phosphopantetheinyl transferase superfamily protein [Streptomyces sp. NBC_00247]
MIDELLPAAVSAVEAFGDTAGRSEFPAEEEAIARSTPGRRREFRTVRALARTALADLGVAPAPILPGTRGAPGWPSGVVGAMTHCAGYRAAAVAHVRQVTAIGLDAEPNLPLPNQGVWELVAGPGERASVAALSAHVPHVCWDRLVFSAKESTYKAWFPLTGRWLDFDEAEIELRPDGNFVSRLLVPGPVVDGVPLGEFRGRWMIRRNLLVTAITLVTAGA